MKRSAAVLLTLAVLLCPSVRAAGPGISAASAILIDGESGRVLYAQNAEEERPIASITKLMTALVAVESHPDLSEVVTIRPEWTGVEGSSMYLKAGEELTLAALLYGLLLASGNDAAVAIAGFCAGDVDTFVAWMNDKAAELGMEHTHFENPNGLNDEGHYSTAADMAALARVVMEHEALAKIVGTRSITVAGRTLTNHNKLLWRYEGCTGLKTGYTDRAGRTLVSCAERDGQRLIAVTLNDPNDWADHAALFDYGFAHYRSAMLALANRTFRMLPVTGSLNRFVPVYTASDVYYPLTEGELVKARVELPERVGDKADPERDDIRVDGRPLRRPARRTYLMLNKPRGYVTTLSDEKGRRTVAELVAGCGARVWPVGRLDLDSEGLLLLTDDGALTHALLHPSHEVEKEYRVWVEGDVDAALPVLRGPMELDGYALRPARVTPAGEGVLSVVIHEGRNRQVRRMCAAAGLRVRRLQRVREGELCLGALPVGAWRRLTGEELCLLRK